MSVIWCNVLPCNSPRKVFLSEPLFLVKPGSAKRQILLRRLLPLTHIVPRGAFRAGGSRRPCHSLGYEVASIRTFEQGSMNGAWISPPRDVVLTKPSVRDFLKDVADNVTLRYLHEHVCATVLG